jgi:hypothetical protein
MEPVQRLSIRTAEVKKQDLETESDSIEQEARMIVPGIQALFGFQVIAVSNETFERRRP